MISKERLEQLQFMADNHGHSPSSLERMRKQNVDPMQDPHGLLVQVTPSELSAFLEAFREPHL